VRGLPDLEKLLWCYLLFNEHSNMLGYYLLPLAYMADDLEWSVDKVKRYLANLEKHNLIAYDPATEIVFVCKYLKYNRLSSGAREKGAIARLKDLSESLLLPRLLAAVNEWHPQLAELRVYLEEEMSSRSLFGVHKESMRSPEGDIDIVIDKDIVVDKETKTANSYSEDFETFWSIWISLGRADNKIGAWDNWQTCLKGRNGKKAHDPVVATELLTAGRHYQEKCIAEGTQPRFVMLPTTFLGPNQRWRDYLKKKKHINPDKAYAQKVIEEAKRNGK